MRKFWIMLLGLCLMAFAWPQEKIEDNDEEDIEINKDLYPNYVLFAQIRKRWEKGDYHSLQPLLAKRVSINLGEFRGHYPEDQIVGILKSYFAEIEAIKFKYDLKKMSESRAVASYQYRRKETGVLNKKMLYFYLNKVYNGEQAKWVITTINEI
jgi:hypothetical protein